MKEHSFGKKRLCLIGGGHSHVTIIKQLAIKPVADIQVTLVSPDTYTPYSGMLPGLIAGHYSFEDCHINLDRLCQWAGVKFIHRAVTKIDPDSHHIYAAQFSPIQYDLLSINIGSQPATSDIRGADNYGHTIKPVKIFLQQWQQWLETHAGLKQIQRIVVVGGGAAGVEVLLAMHYRLQNTTSIKAEFTLINSSQRILSSHNQTVQNFFQRHLQSLDIKVLNSSYVTSINQQQLHLKDGSSVDFDFTVWAIHASAQSWLMAGGLKCDSNGFVEVDQYLRSISHPDIFAAGDSAAFLPRPLPKAGVYAVRQGPVLLKNIIATFRQQPLITFKPQQHFLSLLTTGRRHAIASRGPLFLKGKWVWYWKNHIDQSFMRRFKSHFGS